MRINDGCEVNINQTNQTSCLLFTAQIIKTPPGCLGTDIHLFIYFLKKNLYHFLHFLLIKVVFFFCLFSLSPSVMPP